MCAGLDVEECYVVCRVSVGVFMENGGVDVPGMRECILYTETNSSVRE